MALKQLADERITVTNAAAVGFTQSEYFSSNKSDVVKVVCRVETNAVRVNCLTTPTSLGAEGSLLQGISDVFEVTGYDDIKNFKAIAVAGDGYLSCQFFGV